MIISNIDTKLYRYFSLHAEEVLTSNYIKDNNSGIHISNLGFETTNRILQFIKRTHSNQYKYIVLDFIYIQHIQPNILDKITEIRDIGYKLILLNVSEILIKSLSLNNIENTRNILNESQGYDTFYFFSISEEEVYNKKIKNSEIFKAHFEKTIKKYITPYDKKHESSYVYLKSFVDIKKFISHEKPLIYYALYKLAIRINNKWGEYLNDNPILVCQSLTSTFIVSILAKLLNLDILVFDKIGPITKLYNKLEKHNFEKRKYIIVSDLVCLGTEVKITKNLIEFSGGQYLGNVSLVKIETLSRDDIKLNNIDRTISIFSITKNNNQFLNYYIYTDLKPIQ